MNIYPNLKALRTANNFKQEYIADILGISQPEYSKLESGQRRLDTHFIKTLCKLYDVSIEYLLTQPHMMNGNQPAIQPPQPAQPVAPDVITRMLENYTFLVESFIRQQEIHEKLLERLLNDHYGKGSNS